MQRLRHEIPYAARGQVIGLLGGSFDPAHAGHAHITREALKRFGLDRVWWLVSPGNPLKTRGPAPMAERILQARAVMDHPCVRITGIEARLRTQYTAQTLRALQRLYPQVRFVWLMGADNLVQFHLWQDWRDIAQRVPMGILARPGQRVAGLRSPAARALASCRLPARDSQALGLARAPAWCFVNVPMMDVSSSAIRARGAWSAQAG